MKGVVFTEFLEFVESVAGPDVVDEMLETADVPSGGAYTSVGKYDYNEMAALVDALSGVLDAPAPDLIRAFGRHLFGRFTLKFPMFFDGEGDAFSFLETVEGHIHAEVLKLYPDAELPRLSTRRDGADGLIVRYASCRPFGELCVGLIEGCAAHFDEEIKIAHGAVEGGLEIRVQRADDAQAA